jgi:hypothetical protein
MGGWGWLMLAAPTLAAAVPTGREILAFYRAQCWARMAEKLACSARPGTRIRLNADGGFDLAIDHPPPCPSDDDVPAAGGAA